MVSFQRGGWEGLPGTGGQGRSACLGYIRFCDRGDGIHDEFYAYVGWIYDESHLPTKIVVNLPR
jgi:hypothetical protein